MRPTTSPACRSLPLSCGRLVPLAVAFAACFGACAPAMAAPVKAQAACVAFAQAYRVNDRTGAASESVEPVLDATPVLSRRDDYPDHYRHGTRYETRDGSRHRVTHPPTHGHRTGAFRPGRVLFAVVLIVSVFCAWLSVRGRPVPPAGGAAAASRQIVSLACRRCSHVIDLPRQHASRRLFCPRCGAAIPSDV